MPSLIEAEPFLHREVGKNEWMFQYSTGQIGQTCGAAYFNTQNPLLAAIETERGFRV